MNALSPHLNYYNTFDDFSHCLKPCRNCHMTVRVLVAVKNEGHGIAAVVSELMDECDTDDISIVFRVNGIDQAVKCHGRYIEGDDADDYLF